jgi:hypothetical protein
LADLQIRKETYLGMRKHESDYEEMLFNEFMLEYYGLYDELEFTTEDSGIAPLDINGKEVQLQVFKVQ